LSEDHSNLASGSGNVYRDTERPDANLEKTRAIIVGKIICILTECELSTSDVAKFTGVARSDLSRIRNKQLRPFSLDRLIAILGKLDEDIEVNLIFTSRKHNPHLTSSRIACNTVHRDRWAARTSRRK